MIYGKGKIMKPMQLFFASMLAMFYATTASAVSQFDPLTTGVSFTEVIAAIMAIALIGVGWVLAKGGAVTILGFLKRVIGH